MAMNDERMARVTVTVQEPLLAEVDALLERNPVLGSERGGLCPALVVQADPIQRHANTTNVIALTSRPQRAAFPLTVALEAGEGGVTRASWVEVDQQRTVALGRLRGRLGVPTSGRGASRLPIGAARSMRAYADPTCPVRPRLRASDRSTAPYRNIGRPSTWRTFGRYSSTS